MGVEGTDTDYSEIFDDQGSNDEGTGEKHTHGRERTTRQLKS